MSHDNLRFTAGSRAYEIIKGEGLKQDRVDILAGAAGGPRWLILSGIDRVLSENFFKGRKKVLNTIGSSIGCWRFAAYGQKNPGKAFDLFEDSYINQRYKKGHTAGEVSRQSRNILNSFTGKNGAADILNHKFIRMNIIAVKCRGPLSSENRLLLSSGLAAGFMMNLMNRKLLKLIFSRAIFHDRREGPPLEKSFLDKILKIPLDNENLLDALMATASIPMVMPGVPILTGSSGGVFRDGGVTDYHLDLPYRVSDGLILYPHFIPKIIPGWFDKSLRWRKPNALNMENVVLVSPSEEFIKKLPMMKIPDRNDFSLFRGQDEERIKYWSKAVTLNRILGDDFMEAVDSGSIREKVVMY